MKRRGGSGGINEGFDFSDRSDVDYTDTLSDIDDREGPCVAVEKACESDMINYGSDLRDDADIDVKVILTARDDNGDPLSRDGGGNVIVRLDVDLNGAEYAPYEINIGIDLSRGGFARLADAYGGWSLKAGRVFDNGGVVGDVTALIDDVTITLNPSAAGDLHGAPAEVAGIDVRVNSAVKSMSGAPRRLDLGASLYVESDSLTSLAGAPEYVDGSVTLEFRYIYDPNNSSRQKGPDFMSGLPAFIGGDLDVAGVIAAPRAGRDGACERILPAPGRARVGGNVNVRSADRTLPRVVREKNGKFRVFTVTAGKDR